MADELEAARVEREREKRRAVERLRIDRQRQARRSELARLDGAGGGPAPVSRTDAEREAPLEGSAGRSSPERPAGSRSASGELVPRPRAIGGSIRRAEVEAFLRSDPVQHFDLLALNTLELLPIVDGARHDPELLDAVATRLQGLMARVKHDVDDPLTAGAFLRDQVVRWYEKSRDDAGWAERMPLEWGGLFAESRATGGRIVPWINVRLSACRDRVTREGRLAGRIRERLSRDRPGRTATARTPSQQIHGEVAQAILDDLAGRRRDPDAPFPLVRLSELAVRRQLATVNDALALIFNGPETGPFVVLHPNRYPQCEEMLIRPPGPGSSGAALAYTLAPGRHARAAGGRSRGDAARGPDERAPGEEAAFEGDGEVDSETLWDTPSVSKETWVRVVGEARRGRTRLDPPPKDYRTRGAFATLRDLALTDGEFRKAFLAVKWRGRPAGFLLLVGLLQKGSLAPEVATDHEYLEAELGELVQGDSNWRPPDGVWSSSGWTVTREGSRPGDYRYRAERTE